MVYVKVKVMVFVKYKKKQLVNSWKTIVEYK